MGLSVVAKNFFNYYIIVNHHYNTIKKILWLETISFIIPSFIFLIYIFFKDCKFKRCCSNSNNKIEENNNNIKIKENSNDNIIINGNNNRNNEDNNSINENNNDNNEDENNYLAGYIFVKTDTIYSFIKVKGINKYILSVLSDAKVIFILVINLCSRMQNLKLKTDYKDEISIKHGYFLISYLLSYCTLLFL